MNLRSKLARVAALAFSLALLASHAWPLRAMTATTMDNSNVERWIDAGMNEVCRLAAPVPQLLFSLPPSVFKTDSFTLSWLSGPELQPFQGCLNPDARLIDLTNKVAVLDPIFNELLTTDGLIITQRPADPIPACHVLYSYRYHDKPAWESFWLKSLPVPTAIRSIAFTTKFLDEDGKPSLNLPHRFLEPAVECACSFMPALYFNQP